MAPKEPGEPEVEKVEADLADELLVSERSEVLETAAMLMGDVEEEKGVWRRG